MKVKWSIDQTESIINVPITFNESDEFIKLYEILKDSNFTLTNKQILVFEKIQEGAEMMRSYLNNMTRGVDNV